ncbi:hypothetical protein INR49_027463 [Caranx melampygus]|nr:hypothetical protein INR49_027463 [Caranx melampygus]
MLSGSRLPPPTFLVQTDTNQHIHIEHPAVFSSTDAEALQVHAVFVVEDFVEAAPPLIKAERLPGWLREVLLSHRPLSRVDPIQELGPSQHSVLGSSSTRTDSPPNQHLDETEAAAATAAERRGMWLEPRAL